MGRGPGSDRRRYREAMETPVTPAASADAVVAEVRSNILAQPLAPGIPDAGTVADLNLPEGLVTRIADRVIRESFEERHRSVFEDRPGRTLLPIADGAAPEPDAWPANRAFRAVVRPGEAAWPEGFPGHDEAPELRAAAIHIASRLAFDGLPATAAYACTVLAPLLGGVDESGALGLLRRAGLPVDLLACFRVEGAPLTGRLIAGATRGEAPAALAHLGAKAVFAFGQTLLGFRAADDSGGAASKPGIVRVQMTRASHWDAVAGGGKNSGDNLDLLLQLLAKLPGTRFQVAIEGSMVEELRAAVPAEDLERITFLAAPARLSQWAQDNLKPGTDAGGAPAALAPRYASRAETGAKVAAGECGALAGIEGSGVALAHSALLFQGGNLLLSEVSPDDRLLLVGEAEIARNVALGLTPEQALEALRVELGATTAAVLPAVSFHVDAEVCVRVVEGKRLAFVNNENAAIRIILDCGLRTLETLRLLARNDARVLRTFIEQGNDEQAISRLGGLLSRIADQRGNLPASFAERFRTAAADSGIGNLHRILLVLEMLAARQERAWEKTLHPHAKAYLDSFRRRTADRAAMVARLQELGMEVIPIPGVSHDGRSASAINALNLPDGLLMPARGGLLKPLDDAAAAAFKRALPSAIRVVPVNCAESERRGGAVHCSVAVFPDPNVS